MKNSSILAFVEGTGLNVRTVPGGDSFVKDGVAG